MIRRLFLVLWMLIISDTVFAQDENQFTIPDYAEIENLTKDENSVFYYEKLFNKYQKNDTDLSQRDYMMLYYGFFFQPSYAPFYLSPEADSIKLILVHKDELGNEDWNEIIRLGSRHLEKNPFDLKGLNIVWVAHRQSGDSATARLYFHKLKNLVQTILSTGDGMSEKTAIHVLNISHEYDLIHILGYEFNGNQQLTDDKRDYLSLKTNNDNIPGLYFDVNQIFKGYEKYVNGKAP